MKKCWLLQDDQGREWILSLADGKDRPERKQMVTLDRLGAVVLLDGIPYRFTGDGFVKPEVKR